MHSPIMGTFLEFSTHWIIAREIWCDSTSFCSPKMESLAGVKIVISIDKLYRHESQRKLWFQRFVLRFLQISLFTCSFLEHLALFRGSIPYSEFFSYHSIPGKACDIYINCVLLCFDDEVDIISKELINKTKSHFMFLFCM